MKNLIVLFLFLNMTNCSHNQEKNEGTPAEVNADNASIDSIASELKKYPIDSIHWKIEEDILGSWSHLDSESGEVFYKKQAKLQKESYGLEFKKGGTLIVRQNKGRCGTPPITYKNFKGTWEKVSESILVLKYTNALGGIRDSLFVQTLNKKELKAKRKFTRLERKY